MHSFVSLTPPLLVGAALLCWVGGALAHGDDGHADHGHGDHGHGERVPCSVSYRNESRDLTIELPPAGSHVLPCDVAHELADDAGLQQLYSTGDWYARCFQTPYSIIQVRNRIGAQPSRLFEEVAAEWMDDDPASEFNAQSFTVRAISGQWIQVRTERESGSVYEGAPDTLSGSERVYTYGRTGRLLRLSAMSTSSECVDSGLLDVEMTWNDDGHIASTVTRVLPHPFCAFDEATQQSIGELHRFDHQALRYVDEGPAPRHEWTRRYEWRDGSLVSSTVEGDAADQGAGSAVYQYICEE